MSDENFDEYDGTDENENEPQEQVPNWRRNLERKAKKEAERATAAEDRATKAERLLAFLKAGVNPDDPKAEYFVKGYDGDLTSEALSAAAAKAGLIEAAVEPDTHTAEERAAHGSLAQVSAGGESPGAHGIDEAIAEAEQAGNTLLAISLKRQRAGLHTQG